MDHNNLCIERLVSLVDCNVCLPNKANFGGKDESERHRIRQSDAQTVSSDDLSDTDYPKFAMDCCLLTTMQYMVSATKATIAASIKYHQ